MAQPSNKLSFDLKQAWIKESVLIENRSKKVADFRCFVKFVIEQLDVANSLFGSKNLGTKQYSFDTCLTKLSNLKYLFTLQKALRLTLQLYSISQPVIVILLAFTAKTSLTN